MSSFKPGLVALGIALAATAAAPQHAVASEVSATSPRLAPATVSTATSTSPGGSPYREVGRSPVRLRQPTDPGLGTLTPTADAPEQGMFGPVKPWAVIPLLATLTPTGSVVASGTPEGGVGQRGISFDVWSPGTDEHRVADSMMSYDSFCAGSTLLLDGRVAMVGGNTSRGSHIIDPVTLGQTHGQELSGGRWYGTVLRRPDGRLLVMGGKSRGDQTAPGASPYASTPETGDPEGGWRELGGATDDSAFGGTGGGWWYPRAWNAPDGRVLVVSKRRVYRMNDKRGGSISRVGTLPTPMGSEGSALMYAPGKVLLTSNHRSASVVDLTRGWGSVRSVAPLRRQRNWHNLTVLPDGDVLATGGTRVGYKSGPVRRVERWDPDTNTWRLGAEQQRWRTYHSTALLLPSGAVLTAGGGAPGPQYNTDSETYYPPYLFERTASGAVRWADRPAITEMSGDLRLGGSTDLVMSDDRPLREASLTSMGGVTHSLATDQRRIPLRMQQRGSRVTVDLPGDPNVVVPGFYLLTVVDDDGHPSPGQVVRLGRTGPGQVTVFEHGRDVAPAALPKWYRLGGFDDVPARQVGTSVSPRVRAGRWDVVRQVRFADAARHGGRGASGTVLETGRSGSVRSRLVGFRRGERYSLSIRAARDRRAGPGPVVVRAEAAGQSARWSLTNRSDRRFRTLTLRFTARRRTVWISLSGVRSPRPGVGSVLDRPVVRPLSSR